MSPLSPLSPKWRALLAALLLTSGCASANHGSKAPKEPEYHEDFCGTDDEAEAFTVIIVRVETDAVDHSFRMPIARHRRYLIRDKDGNYGVPGGCMGAMRGINADNPFSGTGFNGFVSLNMSAKGGDISISFSWTRKDRTHGSIKAERPFSWGTPVRYEIEEGVVLSATFEAPKKDG